MEEFGCSLEVANLGLSLYVLGTGLGPLLFSPLSEVLCNPFACCPPITDHNVSSMDGVRYTSRQQYSS